MDSGLEEIPILARSDNDRVVRRVLGHYDAPAFIRRARRVQEALDSLLVSCRQQREQWLRMPRLHLGVLKGLASDWHRLRPWLIDDDQLVLLGELETELTLRALTESLETFNRRWLKFLATIDLTSVNEARDGYNRYYLLEKECAMRSVRLARQGFKRLESLTIGELMTMLPILPIPKLID
jgi:hypothetical protein